MGKQTDQERAGFLIGRVLLDYGENRADDQDPRADLSAVASDVGGLWLASDEMSGVSRLLHEARGLYGQRRYLALGDALALPERGEEIDIEGMDFADGALWLVGSHTSTRKKVKGSKSAPENLERLTRVERRPNRFVVARLVAPDAERDTGSLAAARLPISDTGNPLTDALREDPHLGPFVHGPGGQPLASKENGFDIEGLAVHRDRLFLGLRGPVLRGWSLVLEIAIENDGACGLRLRPIGADGALYRKHFLDLSGMGVRDLVWRGEDLLILSGPTMDISGRQTLFRLEGAADLGADSITDQDEGRLKSLFDLPRPADGDKAEGLALFDGLGEPGLLVVYDAPRAERLVGEDAVLADVFRLPDRG